MAAIHTVDVRRRQSPLLLVRQAQEAEAERMAALQRQFSRRTQRKQLQTAAANPASQSHYRRAADTFASDADGIFHVWNGIDKPRRFSAAIGSYETAGVVAPISPVTVSGRGSGNIVGDFYAYVRFVDRDGNYSSFSPISEKFTAFSAVATVTGATNASPIVITTAADHGLGTRQTVKIREVMGNGAANGIFSVRVLTSTTFELWTDSTLTVPVEGGGVYNSGGQVETGVSVIIYNNIPVSTEAKVTRRQILRNRDGSLATFYVDIDTTDLTSASLESMTESESLLVGESLVDEAGLTLVDKSLPPTIKKFVAFQNGLLFSAGTEVYSEGAAIVTNGSTTVTGIGTEWGPLTFQNRFFEVVGGSKRYEIAYCSSATSLTLTEAYAGSTNPFAKYAIHTGDGERKTVYWSEPAEFEAWPLENTLTLAEDPGAGEITGLMAQRSWLYVLCEHRVFRFSFVNKPLLDGYVVQAAKRGCANNRCWVQAEDIAYMLDSLGFHAFAGNDDADIGSPAVQDLFRTTPSGPYRISWNARANFHAVYDPGSATIRWFVSLDGSWFPRHAVAFHIRLKRWWIEEYPWPVGASCLGRLNGKPQVYLGTTGKRFMALGASTLDGPKKASGTVRGTVTSSGGDWIADSTATFPTSGIVGAPLVIVRGKGKGQRRTIYSTSGTRINVTDPWTDLPDTTSVYQIGGISWKLKTGWMRWAEHEYKSVRAVTVQSKPTTSDAEMYLRLYRDLQETAEGWTVPALLSDQNGIAYLQDDPATDLTIQTTKSNGYVTQRLDAFREWFTDGPRFVAVELAGVQNQEQQTVFRIGVDGATP